MASHPACRLIDFEITRVSVNENATCVVLYGDRGCAIVRIGKRLRVDIDAAPEYVQGVPFGQPKQAQCDAFVEVKLLTDYITGRPLNKLTEADGSVWPQCTKSGQAHCMGVG